MCIRDSGEVTKGSIELRGERIENLSPADLVQRGVVQVMDCLLYTSDAADERSSVDLGGRRIIKKKKKDKLGRDAHTIKDNREIR